MKLKKDSWFMKYYLMNKSWDVPHTVCQLAWQIFGMTLAWLFCAVVLTTLITPVVVILWTSAVATFTDTTWASLLLNQNVRLSLALTAVYLMLGVWIGYMNWRFKRRITMMRKPDGPVRQFAKGMWARIKDKTCVIIEYKDNN
jgi:hypothetical protein